MTGDDKDVMIRGGDVHTAKLLHQLKQFQTTADEKSDDDRRKENQASYSLYMSSGSDESAALSVLAARLSALESSLAASPDQMNLLTMETGKKTVTEAAQVSVMLSHICDPPVWLCYIIESLTITISISLVNIINIS